LRLLIDEDDEVWPMDRRRAEGLKKGQKDKKDKKDTWLP
jgi:hypothetical protein